MYTHSLLYLQEKKHTVKTSIIMYTHKSSFSPTGKTPSELL
jgi:hypothetical protein